MDKSTQKREETNKISGAKSSRIIGSADFQNLRYFPQTRQIQNGKQIQKLTPTSAVILEHFIYNKGREIQRHEIVSVTWPRNKEVPEANFYQAIRRLRKSLGDTKEPRKIIVNPSKNVYALQPEVTIYYKRNRQEKRVLFWQALILVVLVASCLITYLNWPLPKKIVGYKASDYQAITTLRGQVSSSAMSPDDTIVVFGHRASDSSGLALKAKRMGLEEYATLVPYSGSMYNDEPSFSPSGKQLAWVASDYKERGQCHIMIANFNSDDLTLKNPRVAIDCSATSYGRTPQWKTENILLVSLPVKPGKPSGIVEFDLVTGNQNIVTAPAGVGYGDYALFYNYSTNQIAYVRQSSSTGTGAELRLYDYATRTDTRIKNYSFLLYTVAWLNDNELLTNGDDGLEVISLKGQTLPIVSDSLRPENYPFSIDENQIGFVKGNIFARDIEITDLEAKTKDNQLSSVSHDYIPVIAKKSGDIAFVSNRSGKFQVFVTNKNVTPQVSHYKDMAIIRDIAISPNGNLIAIVKYNQLTILNRQGKELYHNSYFVNGLSFSTDGKNLFFGIKMEDSQLIKRVNLRDYSESNVTDGFMPKVDEAGYLYFFRIFKKNKHPILHKMARGGGVVELFETPFELENSNSFEVIQNKLYYVTDDEKEQLTLVSQNISTGKITQITSIADRKFSLNKDATKLVTTTKGVVQNNLASFRLVRDLSSVSL